MSDREAGSGTASERKRHVAADAQSSRPAGAAQLHAVFASGDGVYAVDLSQVEAGLESTRGLDEIKQDLPGGLAGTELFLMGIAGELSGSPREPSERSEPKFYFSAVEKLDVDSRKSLLAWFDAAHSGTAAFGRTQRAEDAHRSQRIAWAALLKSLPFLHKVTVRPGENLNLELSYVGRTGAAGSGISLGLNMNYQLMARYDPSGRGLTLKVDASCISSCGEWPECPHPFPPDSLS